MQGSRAVQVVLGEGEPGILRFVLEAEGFHVVGQARGDAELRRILDATHPSVIVLDAGISATAALEARARCTGAQLVVVWPNGVRTSVAEERVDPATALHDLGGAVRRAAQRASVWDERVVTLPGSRPIVRNQGAARPLTLVTGGADVRTARRSRHRLLVIAVAVVVALTASAAAGLWRPPTFGLFERKGTPHRPAVSTPGPSEERGGAVLPEDPDASESGSCRRSDRTDSREIEDRRPDEPGGCGDGRAEAHGRPDEPNDGGKGDGGNGGGSNGPNGKATGQASTNTGRPSSDGRGDGSN